VPLRNSRVNAAGRRTSNRRRRKEAVADGVKLERIARGHYQGIYRGDEFEIFEQWYPSGLSQGWFVRDGQNVPVWSGNSRGQALRAHMFMVDGKI
jgi:hypothetical protein